MTAIDVEVQVVPAPSIDVEVQFGDGPQIDVAVQVEPPTFTVMSVLPTGPRGPAGLTGADGDAGPQGDPGADGDPGVVQSIVAGANVTVDDTDPANPIVASTGGSGDVDDAVILAPATSARNVIEGDGDVTELTLKASVGQTEPILVGVDSDGNEVAVWFGETPWGITGLVVYDPANASPFDGSWAALGMNGSEIDFILTRGDASQKGFAEMWSNPPDSATGSGFNFKQYSESDPATTLAEVLCKVSAQDGGAIGATLTAFTQVLGVNQGSFGIFGTETVGRVYVKPAVGQTEPILDLHDENDITVYRVDPLGRFAGLAGDGSPLSNAIDPTVLSAGVDYLDTTNGARYLVILNPVGPTLEWVLVGGEVDGAVDAEGVILGNGQAFVGKSIAGPQAQISDVDAYNGSGNGIKWFGTGVDGEQSMLVRVGPVGFPIDLAVFADGTVEFPRDVYFDRATHASGAIGTSAGEPADGDISAGECFRWFDPTAGSPCVKFKARDENGDLYSGTAPLTAI